MMQRFLWLVLTLLTVCPVWAQSTRPGDLLRNAPGMHSTTLDRFHVQLHGNGLGGAFMGGAMSGPSVVLLDGMPIGDAFLGAMTWNALPFATGVLDTLYVEDHWYFAPDRSPSDGAVHVRTRYAEGWNAAVSFMPVNETGDPGPDLFRRAGARNVDRSGPATDAVVAFRRADDFVELGYRFDEHHMTDQYYSDRVWRSYDEWDRPRARIHAPWMRARMTPGSWRAQALLSWSQVRDFRYITSFGREWPTREEDRTATVQVERHSARSGVDRGADGGAADGSWTVGLRVAAHDKTVESRRLRIQAPPRIRTRSARSAAWVGGCRARTCLRLETGAYVQEVLQDATPDGFPGVDFPRTVTASVAVLLEAPRVDVSVRGWSEVHGRRVPDLPAYPHSGAATVRVRPIVTPRHTMELHGVAQSRRPPIGTSLLELHRLGVWFADFLPPADDTGILVDPGYFTRQLLVDVGIRWDAALSPVWRVNVDATVRHLEGLSFGEIVRTHVVRRSPVFRETHIRVGSAGQMLATGLRLTGEFPSAGMVSASYRYTRRMAYGELPFWMAMEGLPPHLVDVQMDRTIRPRLSARLYVSARSPHDVLQYGHSSAYSRPWTVRSEASVVKHLFGSHGTAMVSLLNVPDAPLLEHPAAGNEQLALRIRLEVLL